MLAPALAWEILDSAEQICSAAAVTQAVQRVAGGITQMLAAHNPLVLTATVAILGAAALLACLFPARRAALIDPIQALRTE